LRYGTTELFFPNFFFIVRLWSSTLREEYRLRVVENRVLGRIFGPKRDEVTGEWRKLHKEGLNICSSPTILFG